MNIPKTNIRQLYHVACTIGEVVNGKLETRLSKLCTSDRINIWSKYKPVIHHFTDRPTDWWKGSNLDCGIKIKQQYSHNKPENNFRLGDFAGYNPTVMPVLRDVPMAGILYQSATSMSVTAMYKDGNYTDYEIPPEDIYNQLDTNWYFGLAIKRGTKVYWMTNSEPGSMSVTVPVNANSDTIFTTGTAQMVAFISQCKKPGFYTSSEGSSKFCAIPMATMHEVTIKASTIEASIRGVYANGVLTYTVTVKNTTGSSEIINQCVAHVTDTTGDRVYYIDTFDTPGSIGGNQQWTYEKEHVNDNLPMSGKLELYINYALKAESHYLVMYE